VFDPLRRIFSPSSSTKQYDESEWLYQTLLTASPPRHFFRTFAEEYILFVDCPGIPPSAIKVQLSNNRQVKIQGAHEACIEEKGTSARMCVERQFDREYRFPEDVNPDAVESAIKDGVLAIRFPRIQTVGREVPVKQVKCSF
jgi:HSP20 family molecular chaperone IbpA